MSLAVTDVTVVVVEGDFLLGFLEVSGFPPLAESAEVIWAKNRGINLYPEHVYQRDLRKLQNER